MGADRQARGADQELGGSAVEQIIADLTKRAPLQKLIDRISGDVAAATATGASGRPEVSARQLTAQLQRHDGFVPVLIGSGGDPRVMAENVLDRITPDLAPTSAERGLCGNVLEAFFAGVLEQGDEIPELAREFRRVVLMRFAEIQDELSNLTQLAQDR